MGLQPLPHGAAAPGRVQEERRRSAGREARREARWEAAREVAREAGREAGWEAGSETHRVDGSASRPLSRLPGLLAREASLPARLALAAVSSNVGIWLGGT